MRDIRVVPEGKKFKILINFIQRGPVYASKLIANNEAQKIDKQMPRKTNE